MRRLIVLLPLLLCAWPMINLGGGGPSDPYDLGTLPSIVSDIQWPTEPTITSTFSHVSGALVCNVDGRRTEIPNGSFGGCTITCDDCEFVADNPGGAIITSTITLGGNRIKLEGLETDLITTFGQNPSDVTLDNVYASGVGFIWGGIVNTDSIPIQRMAILNTTLENLSTVSNTNWAFYTGQANDENTTCQGLDDPHDCCTGAGTGCTTPGVGGNRQCTGNETPYSCCTGSGTGSCTFSVEDLIIANSVLTTHVNSPSPQTSRFQDIGNLVLIDSFINPDGNGSNGMRIHCGVTDLYIKDTTIIGGWASSSCDYDVDEVVIDGLTRYRNSTFGGPILNGDPFNELATGSTCTINNSQAYSSTTGVGSPPSLTSGCTGTNPNILSWDGTTYPSVGTAGHSW